MISVTAAIQQITACRTSWGKSIRTTAEALGCVLAIPPAFDGAGPSPELILPLPEAGTRLTGRQLALLTDMGIARVSVQAPPSVVFIGIGEGDGSTHPQINRLTVEGALAHYGIPLHPGIFVTAGTPALQKAVEESMDADIMIICGNIPPKMLTDAGVEQVFNRVKAHPCQPFWFGYSPTKTRVFLMPSHPFAVQVAVKLFLESYLKACWSMGPIKPWLLPYTEHRSPVVQLDEYLPAATVHRNGLKVRAMSFSGKTDIAAAARADGIICHSIELGSLEPSSLVPFFPWHDPS
ncbi:MoeA family protein [Chitinophaga deserti]|uniref:hypothetical protein n=1 Tax=Chitinophaga deserti TaxID=2164099 RepID=UPI000D6B990A|nr:hypothetical protein [Chitinophaga deserti]